MYTDHPEQSAWPERTSNNRVMPYSHPEYPSNQLKWSEHLCNHTAVLINSAYFTFKKAIFCIFVALIFCTKKSPNLEFDFEI